MIWGWTVSEGRGTKAVADVVFAREDAVQSQLCASASRWMSLFGQVAKVGVRLKVSVAVAAVCYLLSGLALVVLQPGEREARAQ